MQTAVLVAIAVLALLVHAIAAAINLDAARKQPTRRSLQIDAATMDAARELARQGHRDRAIEELRSRTGLAMGAATTVVDRLWLSAP